MLTTLPSNLTSPRSEPSANPAITVAKSRWLVELSDELGIPLWLLGTATGSLIEQSHPQGLAVIPATMRIALANLKRTEFFTVGTDLLVFVKPVRNYTAVLTGYVRTAPATRPEELVLAATSAGMSAAQLDRWLSQIPVANEQMLRRMLQLADRHSAAQAKSDQQAVALQELIHQRDYTNSEVNLLHELAGLLHLSHSPAELAEQSLLRLHSLMSVEGHLVVLDDANAEDRMFLTQGTIPLNESSFDKLIHRLEPQDGTRPILKNGLANSLLGADFPGLRNFIMIPITSGEQPRGWIMSCNTRQDRDFGVAEARLLASIADILGTHLRNVELYREHEELMLSFVRSLVSTLDAKDRYTRGHSERVALIARCLGEQLQLPPGDLEAIYLSGLLHDLGKIGVDDSILAKPGQLTEAEFQQIQKHPVIGYDILKQLKNLQHILPGVRNHHESVDGQGYPDGLRGEEIPLMARIMAVADAYDAMGSDRPYRKGMPLDQVEEIFRKGSGVQWDPQIIDAYFAARDEILQLCMNYNASGEDFLAEQTDLQGSTIIARTLFRTA